MTVIEITNENFEKEVEQSDIPVLLDFWAQWCPPCKMLGPVFEQLSGDFEGTVKFAKINVDENQELAKKYDVSGIPALIMTKGGKEIDRMVGFMAEKDLRNKIDEILGL